MDQRASSVGPKPRRGFAALHRDTWRVVRRSPAIFLLLPAAVWFPIDLATEWATAAMNLGEWEELRYSIKIERLMQWIFGMFVASVQLQALALLAKGERPRLGRALREGIRSWGRLMGVFFSASWRSGLALLLLVVPGVVLMVRYSLAYPVAVFEGKTGVEALRTSTERTDGSRWAVFGYSCLAAGIYFPLLMTPAALLPVEPNALGTSLAVVPMNVCLSLFPVALTLFYTDRRQDWSPMEPVGLPDPAGPAPVAPPVSGRLGVGAVGGLSLAALALVFIVFFAAGSALVLEGDLAYERGDYDTALAKFTEAAELDPDDPYVQSSLGWILYEMDDVEAAEPFMARAAELVPDDPYALAAHADVLLSLDRIAEAKPELDRAVDLAGVDRDALEYIGSLRQFVLEYEREHGPVEPVDREREVE